MPISKSKNAILVLESPWKLDDYDANRSSVLPFVQGIAKMHGNTEVYSLNFYNKASFDLALECLCRQKFDNTIVYVAAHGSKTHIGDVSLKHILTKINEKSRKFNIKGLMLGSCFAGSKTWLLEGFTEDSKLTWCAGYSSSCYWLQGTMIDCAIIHRALSIEDEHYQNREDMEEAFAAAIAPFAPNSVIGTNAKDESVALSQSLQFVIQPEGRGFRARLSSEPIFEKAEEYRFSLEEDAIA
ncbi:hypothetical protein D3C75_256150 [compost metagenome]|jgi:hypothetical protein|uniref:Uncharacterized protein n=1 Tax=Silvania hatchlandensis TaxID=2926469 RepID=A0A9J6Q701_9ENTR|nr:hypothetical protein [Silvania hatchlandensis]MCU6665066.1 hypothetical protein [Silvania hatchlandensis]